MIFRIEDTSNPNGNHRKYSIPLSECPTMMLSDLSAYISNEIRKEVNNAKDRRLLSYSKSLMICLMKYNQFSDNELHINTLINQGSCGFFHLQHEDRQYLIPFDLRYDLSSIKEYIQDENVTVINFAVDISDNKLLDLFLERHTNIHRKKVASPEKDYEVLLFQSPNDLILIDYLKQVYILLALSIKYSLPASVANYIIKKINELDDHRFDPRSNERAALIHTIQHIYFKQQEEKQILSTITDDEIVHFGFDSIYQFKSIIDPETSFDEICNDDSYYNCNVVSDIIMDAYRRFFSSLPFTIH